MPSPLPSFPTLARLWDAAAAVRVPGPSGQSVAASPGDATSALPRGLDFTRQDYLALGRLPLVRSAGKPSPDAAPLLARRLARFLALPVAQLHASGTAAIRAVLGGLLTEGDTIIIDAGAPAALFAAAQGTGARLLRTPPGSLDGVERRLARLARLPRCGRLFVAVPAVAGFTSVVPDLPDLLQLCASHGARLIVDVSHDLGSTAQSGLGVMELQGCLGQVDVVLGSLAKCFAAEGGFAAFRDPELAPPVRPAAPLSPDRAATILAALTLIDSPEGRRRRRCLHGTALRLRNHLMADGLRVLGQPSPLVPVPLPPALAEPMTALLRSAGPQVPLVRAPLVAGLAPRWRFLLSSDHGPADIDDLADLIRDVARTVLRRHPALRQPEAIPQR